MTRITVTFQIEPDQLKRLQHLKESWGIPHSDSIRRALDTWFEQPNIQTLFDLKPEPKGTRKVGKKSQR
jgi:hypothetical protein